ncbi:MAG: Asp-tRNA(Asn)/Glu-tRNA(Gln) amidotransferase subunit GatC [Candidatus Nealsonbacteria bacterium]|nr:Asp-tRNA(Asn)/Glu-tRNA(Gln) amidotransferase subunit GatC [Candidatus Nealsonbacteria bacterium]
MIPEKDVKRIANLARLSLSPAEIKQYQKELSPILDYIGVLKKADITKADVTSHPREALNVFRKDEAFKETEEEVGKLVQAAPDKKEGYIKVKSVLK